MCAWRHSRQWHIQKWSLFSLMVYAEVGLVGLCNYTRAVTASPPMEGLTEKQTAFHKAMLAWMLDPEQHKRVIAQDNALAVMKTVSDLMQGQGLAFKHLPGPRWLQGFAFDPEQHCPVQLRALGKQWLPLRRPAAAGNGLLDRVYDSSNGWVINHAAGCIHKFMVATNRPLVAREPLPLPPPPPTPEQLKTVENRPFGAGGRRRETPAGHKRPKEEAPAPSVVPVTCQNGEHGTPPPKKQALADLKRPPVPDLDVQESRILFRNSSLVKHLRAHPRGDWVKNPHRKVAGRETLAKTKDRAADAIKGVVREWLLTTPAGRRALAAAEVGEGELSIDRLIARHEKGSMNGLNCLFNLYLMPVRHNAYFGPELTAEKRAYVGERAYQLAKEAHETFVRDTEGEYDWDNFYKKAETIVNRG